MPPRLRALTAVLFLLGFSGIAAAQPDSAYRAMNRPVAPFRIADNLYYVGASDVTVFLFTTPAGDILLDGGFAETAPQVLANIRRLGFDPRDVRLLLGSHAHFDHAGGFAALRRATGAKLVAMQQDVPLLLSGGRDDWDGFSSKTRFDPIRPDSIIHDGAVIQLGGTKLVAHVTPGHTPGCTTWTTTLSSGGRRRSAVFMCSLSVPGYKLVGNSGYPTIASDYVRAFNTVRALPCEFFFGSHGSFFDLTRKSAEWRAHPGADPNPFIDPAGCAAYVNQSEAAFRKTLSDQGGH